MPEADKWHTSMEKELNALKKKETWIEILKAETKGKILLGKWVYKIKDDGIYKSRWVI